MPTAPKTYRPAGWKHREKGWASRQAARRPIYSSDAWKRLRDAVLRRDFWMCLECKRQGRDTMLGAYAQVDHIQPAVSDDDVLCDVNNLQALCPQCHSRKTVREQWFRR